jgi:hypothetical protein
MPLLVAGFFVLQLDRSNIGNALTDTIVQDLEITTDDVNLGNQLMLAGIVIAEIPSNIILQRLGAPVWLTIQMLIWGMIALTQAWCTNMHSFLATRFLLGLFEGGYIPGAQYMLALFYTRDELALRTAVFYFGNYSATACGSLIAAGVLQMGGINGLSGWQWLFISKTLPTRCSRTNLTTDYSRGRHYTCRIRRFCCLPSPKPIKDSPYSRPLRLLHPEGPRDSSYTGHSRRLNQRRRQGPLHPQEPRRGGA